jgi:hypothetical protein
MLDWQAFDRAVELGYRHAAQTLGGEGGATMGGSASLRRILSAGAS